MNAHTTAQSRPSYDRCAAALYLDIMEDQKDKLHSMLIAIRNEAPAEDMTLRNLIRIATEIVESHASWYQLRDCLGIKREDKE